MPDLFDELLTEAAPKDIFDEVGMDAQGDIFDEVSGEMVQEAQRASAGAVQALDVMRAPGQLNWSDANEKMDAERFRDAESAQAQATLAEERGSGTGPGSDAFAWRREADRLRGDITPFTRAGQQVAATEQGQLQSIENAGNTTARRGTPSELLSGFLGPGLTETVQPVIESAGRNIGPAIGGAIGAARFIPHPGAQAIAAVGMPIMGALMGGMAGTQAQEALLQTTETPEETAARNQRAAEDAARDPGLTKIGAMAAQLPFFGPSIAQFGRAAAGDIGAMRNIGIGGTIGAVTQAGVAKLEGREVNPEDVAEAFFMGAVMNEPTKLGRKLGLHPSTEQAAKEAAEAKYADGVPPVGGRAELESGLTNRPTTSTADVFERVTPKPTDVGNPITSEAPPSEVPSIEINSKETPPAEPPSISPAEAEPAPPSTGEPVAQAGEEPTGIRNSIVDARRVTAQMAEREAPARRAFGEVLDEAKAIAEKDADAPRRLVEELKREVRPLTDTEDALLTLEQNRREIAREDAIEAVNKAQTEEEKIAAQERLAFTENEAFDIYQVGQNAGTANARGLNARRIMLNRDFTLAKMLNETRAVRNHGEPLSEAQVKEVTGLHQRIAELEKKLSSKEAREAQKAAQNEYKKTLRDTQDEARIAAKEKRSVVDFFESQAEKARQRIIARRGKLQTTIDPLNIAGLVDEAIIGASHLAKGVRDFAQWSKKMLSEFGDRIKPQIKALYDRATEIEAENANAFVTKKPTTPEEVLQGATELSPALVRDLAQSHIRAGVDGFENVMGAVEKDLKSKFPDVTPRQLNDALSGYGKTKQPSKAEDKKKLAEYRSIARLLSQLEDATGGKMPLKTGQQRNKPTARVRELQKQVNDAIEEAGLVQKGENNLASRLDAAKSRLRNATEELQRKINRNDYTERPTREQPVDRERIDLEFDLAKVKHEYQQGLIKARRARRSIGEKIWDSTKETFNLSRQLLTSGDLPPIFRQGLFSIGRPKMAYKALKDALGAMVSEKKRFAIDREIQNRPNAPLYQRAKLFLAKDTGQTLTQQEEAYMGNWFKELPRWTVVGPFLRASERSYNTFLNKLRADTFDAAVKAYEIAPTATADLRAVADVVNTMTGRAKLPGRALEQGAAALNTFLFAPRFLASRFKLATGQPLWSGTAKSRKFALEQYARTLAGAALFYGLGKMAGAEIETDPRSTDFLKLKFGNTRLDPLGGLIQVTNFLTRVVTGETKTAKGVQALRETGRPLKGTSVGARGKVSQQGMGSMIGSFLRTKLNPVAGLSVDLATGKDLMGQKVTPGSAAARMTVPISFQDIQTTLEQQRVPKGTALWILSLFGAGLQTYAPRK